MKKNNKTENLRIPFTGRLMLLFMIVSLFLVSSCNDVPDLPEASFTFTADDNRVVIFTNTSLNADQYTWDFGEVGSTSSEEKNPTYTYGSDGTFTVALSAVGPGGTDQVVKTVTVEEVIPAGMPVAKYALTTDNLNLNFENLTNLNDADQFAWDFGDGNTSNDSSPTHTYSEAGRYEVTFTATGPLGSDVLIDSVFVATELKINNGTWDDEAVKDDNREAWRNRTLEALADDFFGDSDYFAKATSSNNHTVGGSYAANLTTNDTSTKPRRWLYQDIIVSPNASYTITFWMKQTADASCSTSINIYEDHFDLPEFIDVPEKIIASQTYDDSTGSSVGDWVEQTFTFETGTSSEVVFFMTNKITALDQSYYDDFTIVKN